jgi:hypothetical protein
MIDVARASACCSASTSLRFCAWNTRRTIASASGDVTRRPFTVRFSMPAAQPVPRSSCGPAPCTTIGRQADFLQESKRGGERVEIVAQHRTADLDHGETLGIELREALEVLR